VGECRWKREKFYSKGGAGGSRRKRKKTRVERRKKKKKSLWAGEKGKNQLRGQKNRYTISEKACPAGGKQFLGPEVAGIWKKKKSFRPPPHKRKGKNQGEGKGIRVKHGGGGKKGTIEKINRAELKQGKVH